MTAGYSGTPLPRKLGIRDQSRVAILGGPDGFEALLAPLPEGVTVRHQARGVLDVVVLFVTRAAELDRRFPVAAGRLDEAGGLWVAWPKKTSGLATDLNFDIVRTTGLEAGLVDNKVCAIDETWSGLRFVIRREDRKSKRK